MRKLRGQCRGTQREADHEAPSWDTCHDWVSRDERKSRLQTGETILVKKPRGGVAPVAAPSASKGAKRGAEKKVACF